MSEQSSTAQAAVRIDKKIVAAQPVASEPLTGVSQDFRADPDRRLAFDRVPKPPVASLRWMKRPRDPKGNPAYSYLVEHPEGHAFAVFVGHYENGTQYPFEVWVNGAEQPRGLGALAKSLSMDMRSEDRGWLQLKLDSLAKAKGDDAFDFVMPDGERVRMPSIVACFARLVRYRCQELQAFERASNTTLTDALMSVKEPKTGPLGTLSWTVDVLNPATGDDFVLFVKEAILPNGQRRPYSVWLSGEYPRTLDGLCKSLSLDMRIVEPHWIGLKLTQLLDYSEPRGEFFARIPGEDKSRVYPSTVAYLAALMLHRFVVLGLLRDDGTPVVDSGVVAREDVQGSVVVPLQKPAGGRACAACGSYAVHRRDGCDVCAACGDSKCA